jgi:hypothetical protein
MAWQICPFFVQQGKNRRVMGESLSAQGFSTEFSTEPVDTLTPPVHRRTSPPL